MTRYRWVRHGSEELFDVGILADGSLHNPRGYPEALVREAVLAADERLIGRRREAAARAAATRKARHDMRVHYIARAVLAGRRIGPQARCVCCGKTLGDEQSIRRGIGPECWLTILEAIEQTEGFADADPS